VVLTEKSITEDKDEKIVKVYKALGAAVLIY